MPINGIKPLTSRLQDERNNHYTKWAFLNSLKSYLRTTLSGGLEPPTSRLTVLRANQLRHESIFLNSLSSYLGQCDTLSQNRTEVKDALIIYISIGI